MRIVNYLAEEFKKENGVDLKKRQNGIAAAERSS
jgi:molecular chaperone DnaK (HSP70)